MRKKKYDTFSKEKCNCYCIKVMIDVLKITTENFIDINPGSELIKINKTEFIKGMFGTFSVIGINMVLRATKILAV